MNRSTGADSIGALTVQWQELRPHLAQWTTRVEWDGWPLVQELLLGCDEMVRTPPQQRTALSDELVQTLLQVLDRLVRRVQEEGPDPYSDGEKAMLCWQARSLLRLARAVAEDLPQWFGLLEEQLTREGAILWRRELENGTELAGVARVRALTLLLDLGFLPEPGPDWAVQAATELMGQEVDQALQSEVMGTDSRERLLEWSRQLAILTPLDDGLKKRLQTVLAKALQPRETPAVSAPEPLPLPNDPEQLIALIHSGVEDWLEQSSTGGLPATLAMVCIPGARLVPHDRTRLELNLAPLLGIRQLNQLDRLVQAFFEPLQRAQRGTGLTLREPSSSLYASLGFLWRQGDQLTLEQFATLIYCTAVWNRCGGPGALGARMLPADFPPASFRPGECVLRPGNVELAALQSVLYAPEQLEEALAAIRRNHLNTAWMERQRDHWWFDPSDVVENLCRLHTYAGFYANAHAPLDDLERWSRGTLGALLHGQVVSAHTTTWFYPVAQSLFEQTGLVPELTQWPGDQAFYDFIAGQEVLFVTPLAADVEKQHRSGKAFDLFSDLKIQPYGLRLVEAPMSIYPNRPRGGFNESLEHCLEQIDVLYRVRPFTVFTAACGGYGLPLCETVKERYGVSCVYTGNQMHAFFGVQQNASASWRKEQRKPENWVISTALNAVPGVGRVDAGRYLG